MTRLLTRKTAPKGAIAYIAAELAHGDPPTGAHVAAMMDKRRVGYPPTIKWAVSWPSVGRPYGRFLATADTEPKHAGG